MVLFRRLALGLLCCFLLAGTFAPRLPAEIVKKKPASEDKKKADPQKPPQEPKVQDPKDVARQKALTLRVQDWELSAATSARHGLRVKGTLFPDALSFKIASGYLSRRGQGRSHAEALGELVKKLPRWKRYEKNCLLLLELRNEKPKVSKTDQRLYTLERSLHREGLRLADSRGRRLNLTLAGFPSNLRLTKLRVKKFWTTSDGLTRRVRPPDDPARGDPLSYGRKAKISKPFPALVLEEKPAEVEILVRQQTVQKTRSGSFVLSLHHWKKYEGPFEKDVLDLNQGRPWDTLKDLRLKIDIPPSGMAVSPEILALVDEVRRAAEASK